MHAQLEKKMVLIIANCAVWTNIHSCRISILPYTLFCKSIYNNFCKITAIIFAPVLHNVNFYINYS